MREALYSQEVMKALRRLIGLCHNSPRGDKQEHASLQVVNLRTNIVTAMLNKACSESGFTIHHVCCRIYTKQSQYETTGTVVVESRSAWKRI